MPSKEKDKFDTWLQSHWRPAMAIIYIIIIMFDFIIAPIFWSYLQYQLSVDLIQWSPLTLISGGIFHAAMGAILGISAFTRGKEKMCRLEYNLNHGNEYSYSSYDNPYSNQQMQDPLERIRHDEPVIR
jgi:hypothetical protein